MPLYHVVRMRSISDCSPPDVCDIDAANQSEAVALAEQSFGSALLDDAESWFEAIEVEESEEPADE